MECLLFLCLFLVSLIMLGGSISMVIIGSICLSESTNNYDPCTSYGSAVAILVIGIFLFCCCTGFKVALIKNK